MRVSFLRRSATIVLLSVVCAAMAACSTTPRQRTLPPSIHSVSVPVFVNRTAEPGLEEDATVYTEEEFLADGRVELVRTDKADAVVRVTLVDFSDKPGSFDADDFARALRYDVRAKVEVVRNEPGGPSIGGVREVLASTTYDNDKRRIGFEPEPVGKERVLRNLAREIVREVLTGQIETEKN